MAFAIALTRAPAQISKEDVEGLKKAGFSDRAIHDACQVIAYFNYVNRVADGLGVELEERFEIRSLSQKEGTDRPESE